MSSVIAVLFVSSLVVFHVAAATAAATNMSCFGEKGNKGDYGHPGAAGQRGLKGQQGLPGSKGYVGEKGSAGARGPAGPRGPQGPNGVIGTPGKPGLQGPPGGTGSEGPVGPSGLPGIKGAKGSDGSKGNLGPRGIAGTDGQPGPPGHMGPTGSTGSKGEKGVTGGPGHKGERGPQGIAGPSIDSQTLKDYFEPVKRLQSDVEAINSTIQTLVEEKLSQVNDSLTIKMNVLSQRLEELQDLPAAHIHASGSGHGPKSSGYTITEWYTASGSTWSPYLRGGMTYSNGYLTVPRLGLYYVYTQLCFYHAGGSYPYGLFRIDVNGSPRAYSYQKSDDQQSNYYMGRILELQQGDRISIVIASSQNYFYPSVGYNFFGAFLLR